MKILLQMILAGTIKYVSKTQEFPFMLVKSIPKHSFDRYILVISILQMSVLK